jgi:Magnesium chelatase, subunit ChlI
MGMARLGRRLTPILLAKLVAEALETPGIHGVAGLMRERTAFVTTRPFRAPHHTISDAGLSGGGQVPMPGEVSLAHNGILFLDELPEFRRHVLEVLRQPLAERLIYIQSPARHQSLRFGGLRRSDDDRQGLGQRAVSTPHHGVVNLLPVDMINEHNGARLPGSSLLCGGGETHDFLPGVESFPRLLTVFGGGEEVTSRAEVWRDWTIRGKEALCAPG